MEVWDGKIEKEIDVKIAYSLLGSVAELAYCDFLLDEVAMPLGYYVASKKGDGPPLCEDQVKKVEAILQHLLAGDEKRFTIGVLVQGLAQ